MAYQSTHFPLKMLECWYYQLSIEVIMRLIDMVAVGRVICVRSYLPCSVSNSFTWGRGMADAAARGDMSSVAVFGRDVGYPNNTRKMRRNLCVPELLLNLSNKSHSFPAFSWHKLTEIE